MSDKAATNYNKDMVTDFEGLLKRGREG